MFIDTRQRRLENERNTHPEQSFHGSKMDQDTILYDIYQRDIGYNDVDFFAQSEQLYRKLAAGMDQLERLLQLPYAIGQ